MYTPISQNGIAYYSEGFVVKFFQSNGTSWVANFKCGLADFSGVFDYPEDKRSVVFACGSCYIMADDEQDPVKTFGFGFGYVFQTHDNLLIAVDQTDIAVIEISTNTIWYSDRLSLAGFKDVKFSCDCVTGLAYEPASEEGEWRFFSFKYRTKTIVGGAFYPQEVKKPCWKIW